MIRINHGAERAGGGGEIFFVQQLDTFKESHAGCGGCEDECGGSVGKWNVFKGLFVVALVGLVSIASTVCAVLVSSLLQAFLDLVCGRVTPITTGQDVTVDSVSVCQHGHFVWPATTWF